jgi:hypothetical protein
MDFFYEETFVEPHKNLRVMQLPFMKNFGGIY